MNVTKVPTALTINTTTVIIVGNDAVINVTLNETINTTVVLRINGTEYNVAIVDGVGNFTIAHLTEGIYYINATYAGDDKYIGSVSQTIELNVTKITTELTVNTTKVIIVGTDALINITLNRTINTTVVVRFNGTEYNVAIVNGAGNLTVAHLTEGIYLINATYVGDGKYVDSESNTAVLNVTKVPTALEINTTAVIIVGTDAVFNVTLNETINATVVLRINGTEYNVAIVNGAGNLTVAHLTEGIYYINATYVGDDKYVGSESNTVVLNVTKVPTALEINTTAVIIVGTDAVFNITLNETINTTVVLCINGTEYVVGLVDGVGNFTIAHLKEGIYYINATYAGDDKYVGSQSNNVVLNVTKVPTALTVNTTAVIIVGTDAIFNITLNETINTTVVVRINGTEYNVAIVNGAGNLTVAHLKEGTYYINATYAGDDKYIGSVSETIELNVTKITTELAVNTTEVIIVGTDAVINVTLNETINTTVIVRFNGTEYNVAIVNGVGNLTVAHLTEGIYYINATYAGDDKYVGSESNTVVLNVTKVPTALEVNTTAVIIVGTDAVFSITLNETINTTVVLRINGTEYVVGLVDGVGNLAVAHLTEGTYYINATYAGDDKYIGSLSETTELNVTKVPTALTINTTAVIIVGTDAVINITLNETINATVVVRFNETEYNVAIINGVGNLTVAHLTEGTYYINATYAGDEKYIGSISETIRLNVTKIPTALIINTTAVIIVGTDAVINITLNETINATVVVRFNGTEYNVAIVDGFGNFTIAHLTEGTYYINATYVGDDKYVGSVSQTIELNATKVPTELTVNTTKVIIVGTDAVINITLNETINATVVLRVNGTEYNVAIVNGAGNLTVAHLTEGTYYINATYAGDDKYVGSVSQTIELNVTKVPTALTINTTSVIIVGSDALFNITLNETINATVVLRINGTEYNVAIVNGAGNFTIAHLAEGTYYINATYAGDDKYVASISKTVELNVTRVKAYLNVTATNATYGNASEITVLVPEAQKGFVRIIVKGTDINVTAEIINGVAKFNATGLDVGEYEAVAYYIENSTYTAANNSTRFNITPAELDVVVIAQNVTVEENISIIVTVPDDFKGNVSIVIDGVVYNGTAKLPLFIGKQMLAGNKTATLVFYGDSNYNIRKVNATFVVNRVNPVINVTIDDVTYPDYPVAFVNISNNANGTVRVLMNGSEIGHGQIINGTARIDLDQLAGGVHEVRVEFNTSDYYNNNITALAKFEVFRANSTIVNITQRENDVIVTVGPAGVTGNVTFIVNGKNFTAQVIRQCIRNQHCCFCPGRICKGHCRWNRHQPNC